MTHTCHPADRRKRNLRRQLAAGIVQQRVYFNFITHYRSFRECQLPSLPSFSLHEFLSRVLLFPSPVRAFTRTRVEGAGERKEERGEGKTTEKQLAVNVPPLRAIPATTR